MGLKGSNCSQSRLVLLYIFVVFFKKKKQRIDIKVTLFQNVDFVLTKTNKQTSKQTNKRKRTKMRFF